MSSNPQFLYEKNGIELICSVQRFNSSLLIAYLSLSIENCSLPCRNLDNLSATYKCLKA